MKQIIFFTIFINCLFSATIEEVSEIVGVRDNQLIGYGLIVGLNGTGDSSSAFYTYQSISNMLQLMNVKIDPASIKSKNVASVLVTAKLPTFTRQGDRISVTVSSIGDASNKMNINSADIRVLANIATDIQKSIDVNLTLQEMTLKIGDKIVRKCIKNDFQCIVH